MIAFKGYPDDGGLYSGYDVLRGGQKIGFIKIGGFFCANSGNISLTEEEKNTIRIMCRRVYEMPSEYGWLGVGETPTFDFDPHI